VFACENHPDEMPRGRDMGPGRLRDTISQAPCPEGSALVASGSAVAGPDGVVPIEVGFTPTPELLVRGVQADPLSLELGLPVTLSFNITADDEQVVALKRVLFTPRVDADQIPNRNPQIAELSFSGGKSEPFTKLDPEAPPTVSLGGKLLLAPAERRPRPTGPAPSRPPSDASSSRTCPRRRCATPSTPPPARSTPAPSPPARRPCSPIR
jgi:hypothetical protein